MTRTTMLFLNDEYDYIQYTVFVFISIIVGVLLFVFIPVTLWINHKRLYAHYNQKDHARAQRMMYEDEEEEDFGGRGEDKEERNQNNNQEEESLDNDTEQNNSNSESDVDGRNIGRNDNDNDNTNDNERIQQEQGDAHQTAGAIAVESPSFLPPRSGSLRQRLSQRGSQSIRLRQQQQQQQQQERQRFFAFYYATSFWTKSMLPDTAMKQLLVVWYFASFIFMLGMFLTLAYLRGNAQQYVLTQQLSDYYGPMQIQNVTIESSESVRRYRWYYYRVFEAKVKLQVSWDCPALRDDNDGDGDESSSSLSSAAAIASCQGVSVYYDPCIQGYYCHRYLKDDAGYDKDTASIYSISPEHKVDRKLQRADDDTLDAPYSSFQDENTTIIGDTNIQEQEGLCASQDKYETIVEAHQCIDDLLFFTNSQKQNQSNEINLNVNSSSITSTLSLDDSVTTTTTSSTSKPSIVLYGDCDSCTAYTHIPDVTPGFHTRLLWNGIFFICMGIITMGLWLWIRRRYMNKFIPKPAVLGDDDIVDDEISERNNNNNNNNIDNNGARRPHHRFRRRRMDSSSNNNPVLNRMRNQDRINRIRNNIEVQDDDENENDANIVDNDNGTVVSSVGSENDDGLNA